MQNNAREEHAARIREMEREAERCGKVHRRDFYRAIKRMKGELKQYDMYRAQAAQQKG